MLCQHCIISFNINNTTTGVSRVCSVSDIIGVGGDWCSVSVVSGVCLYNFPGVCGVPCVCSVHSVPGVPESR